MVFVILLMHMQQYDLILDDGYCALDLPSFLKVLTDST
jgi:hypothetical protein